MNKIPVNRNFVWTETFVNQLVSIGVKYACISPGSRNTPLTISFSKQKKIKCFVHIDERVSGFFALGLAKAANTPVAVVTTSGTATAELYPAIIEAYQQRIPLIICTADRPPEKLNTGANQTIIQRNLYRNHIRWFKNVWLRDLSERKIVSVKRIAIKAFKISSSQNKGPIHLNFPFRRPLEPDSYTDEISKELFDEISKPLILSDKIIEPDELRKKGKRLIDHISDKVSGNEKGLIITGPLVYNQKLITGINQLSKVTGYPILSDGISHLRFNNSAASKNVCVNYDTFLGSENFRKYHKAEFVLHFGRTPTSNILEEYLNFSNPARFIINEYGDLFDPSGKTKKAIRFNPVLFCEMLIEKLKANNTGKEKTNWQKVFEMADSLVEELKTGQLNKVGLKYEPKIISELVSSLPKNTNLMIGNSLPVRDFEWFASRTNKNIKVFFNRGASGIDGVTSTALGIASIQKPVILLTGDLSFLHDLNALISAKKSGTPLIIVLINNNGGGIFNSLPIASNKKVFKDFFITPHNLNIGKIVKSFGLEYFLIKSNLQIKLREALKKKSFVVLEIKTDSVLSTNFRKKIRSEAIKTLEKELFVK